MVMPLPSGPNAVSFEGLPQPAAKALGVLSYLVILLWVISFVFLALQPMKALMTMMLALFGTFMLHEDAKLVRCVNVLAKSIIGVCCQQRGAQLLMPFLIFSGINGVMDLFQVIGAWSEAGTEAAFQNVLFDATLVLSLAELLSCYFAYQVKKVVMPQNGAGGGMGGGGGYAPLAGGPPRVGGGGAAGVGGALAAGVGTALAAGGFGGGAGRPAPGPPSGGGRSVGGGAAGGQSFQAFQGQGNRLGA